MSTRETGDGETDTDALAFDAEMLWTLHAVLGWGLDATSDEEAVSDAVERVESGTLAFTRRELAAVERVLAAAHHRPTAVAERSDIERLLHRVSGRLRAEK